MKHPYILTLISILCCLGLAWTAFYLGFDMISVFALLCMLFFVDTIVNGLKIILPQLNTFCWLFYIYWPTNGTIKSLWNLSKEIS